MVEQREVFFIEQDTDLPWQPTGLVCSACPLFPHPHNHWLGFDEQVIEEHLIAHSDAGHDVISATAFAILFLSEREDS